MYNGYFHLYSTSQMAITDYFHIIAIIFVAAFANGVYLCNFTIERNYNTGYILFSTELLYPILGWLADAKIGRYKAIVYSMILMSVGCVCLAIAWTVFHWYVPLCRDLVVFIVLVLCIVWIRMNTILFMTAALPFITDQMIGASSDQIATAIDWYVWSTYSCIQAIVEWIPLSIIPAEICRLIYVLIILISCALAVSGIFLCHHHLDKQPYITNPIRDIASVLNYARKNKCARNRSALTYWENKTLSRLDLGMEKYGGPFTEEQVEDVKTVLRLLLLIFCSKLIYVPNAERYQLLQDNPPYLNPLFGDNRCQLILFLVPAYYLLIKPLCSIQPVRHYCSKLNSKMSMLKIIGVGILLNTSSLLGYFILDLVSHDVTTANGTCLLTVETNTPSYYSMLMLRSLNGLGGTLQIVTIVKFTLAQTPNKMKGLVYAILLGLKAPIDLIGQGLYKLFLCKAFPQCGLYYCLTRFMMSCVVMVLYVVVSRWYRLRSRNNPINIHHIVETHVARNLDREQEYLRENDNSSLSYGTID